MEQGVPFGCTTDSLAMDDFAIPHGFFESPERPKPAHLLPSLVTCPESALLSPAPSLVSSHLPFPVASIDQDNTSFFRFEEYLEGEIPPHVVPPSSAPSPVYDIDNAFIVGESSVTQQMPNLLPSMPTTDEEPPAPDVQQSPIASMSVGALWYPFDGQDCKSCVTFREIVHANELYTKNLSLHVYSEVLQHAILVILPLTQDIPAEKYITDLRPLDVELVEKFIIIYCSSCIRDGLVLVEDSFQPFLETVTSRMDYSDQHIRPPTPIEFHAGPLFQETNNGSEYCNQNQSEISNSALPSNESSEKKLIVDGVTSAAGHLKQEREQRIRAQQFGNKIQRGRTRSMTFADISKYFHLPIAQACNELQISVTALKNVCRRYNLNRWPYRKVCSTAMKIFTSNECLKYQNNSMAAQTLQLLEFDNRELQKIYCLPTQDQDKLE